MKPHVDSVYVPLAEFEPEKVKWYWPNYLAASVITVLDGDPGIGKSFLAMHVATQFSVGGSLPRQDKLKPSKVIYATMEDDPNFTIRPRIDAMGGNPENIFVQSRFSPFDEGGMKALSRAVEEVQPRLLVIDPLYSFVGAGADIYRPNEIRQVLTEVQQIADVSSAAVLAIRHLRKMKADKAIYQGAGAIDVIGVARCGLLVAQDPNDPSLKVIAHSKHNLSERMASLTYRLSGGGEGRQPRFEWAGTSGLTADDLLGAGSGSGTNARKEAKDFLREVLADGERPAAEIQSMAEDEGFSERTLKRAKRDLGIASRLSKDKWLWRLK